MKAALIALALVATSARAEFLTGNDLLERLQASDQGRQLMGLGYVAGVHDALRGVSHCSPDGIALSQVRDMTIQWITAVPEHRHQSADVLISLMLQRVWPCAQRSGRGA